MNRHRFIFEGLQNFMEENDNVSLDHILKWEYRKDSLFELRNDDGLTLVHQACLDGKLKTLHILIRHGASPHIKSSVGWTPLHAATLGGNKDIISYLLKDCSADPFAKDEMNCLPLDLTMDKSIRLILEEAMQSFKVKKHIESFNSRVIFAPNKDCYTKRRLHGMRSQSMFIDDKEASKLRHIRAKDDSSITTGTILKSDNDVFEGAFARLGVHSIRRKGAVRKSVSSKELHNNCIIREKQEPVKVKTESSTLPRAIRFMTSRKRNTSSSSSSKQRDSGVFEEEAETDIGKSISSNENNHEAFRNVYEIDII